MSLTTTDIDNTTPIAGFYGSRKFRQEKRAKTIPTDQEIEDAIDTVPADL
jgi:hypothetical protein